MKKYFSILPIFFFIMCMAIIPANAQNQLSSKYTFTSLNVDNGLPVNFIDDMYKDSRGFIWIATQGGGLCRYDGYEFLNYNVNSEFIVLKSNFVRQVYEDNFSRLWVASDYGLDIINLHTMLADDLGKENKSFQTLVSKPCNNLLRDSKGNMWLLSSTSLHKISFTNDGNIQNIVSFRSPKNVKNSFTTLAEINGQVLVGRNGSVEKISESKDGQLEASPISKNLTFQSDTYISSLLESKHILWIGTDNGLYKFNQTNKLIERYAYNAQTSNSISQDMVTSLNMTPNGILVIGTLKGINFLNPKTNEIERISHNSYEYQLNSDFVNCILSEGNNLWIGTEAGGINKLTQRKLAIHNYVHNNTPSSISANPVNSIFEDHRGNLWIGTVEGGLNLKQKGENQFVHIKAGNGSITHNSVSALEEDRNGNLWIGTWGGGISVLNLNKLPQKDFFYLPNYIDYVALLKYDPVNHGVWIGTNRDIYFFDILTNSVHTPISTSLTHSLLGTLGCIIDKNHQLWIGTTNGLILADLTSFDHNRFTCKARILQLPRNEINPLFLKNITAIQQSKDNSIWISSNGYGVCQITNKDGKYHSKTYTSDNGLINNSCFSLLEDNRGLIWISTGNGISCFNKNSNRFVNYTKFDGLNNVQFYWSAGFKSPRSNKLYFGNVSGLTEIDGSLHDSQERPRKVIFTKLQVLNEIVNAKKKAYAKEDISYCKEIQLHESDKSFVIEFSALNYDNPATINYSYRLLGFEDKWINVSSDRRFVSYTNLGAGKYRLQVRCSNSSGDWSDNISEIEIIVHPYFYKTVWFIALVLLLIGIGIWQFYQWRIREFRKQRIILHQKVEERTGELARQTILLEQQAVELKQQNQQLSEQNDKILHQRKQLVEMSEKVKEAFADRISFFTNITHEFRTPITLIIGPIERALKLSTNPKVIEQLQFVSRNSHNLLSLVNQLMDFRKVESDNIRIEPKLNNLFDFMKETLLPFDSFVSERNIQLRKIYHLNSPYVSFDDEALRKLIGNLLSNAIKFSPENGMITIYIATLKSLKDGERKLYLCVNDNGTGIDETELQSIFDRFYQSKNNKLVSFYGQSGTGIGLYLCRRIVELMEGSIYAKNNSRKGSSFRILLPLKENVNDEKESEKQIETNTENQPIEEVENKTVETKLTILLVEDNNDMRQYLKSVLSDKYYITEAENGEQALFILKSKKIDFIISDLMMPVMDGLELSKRVKADIAISHIPFLMLTAKTGKQSQISSYRMGADEILFKPFDEEILLARIQNILTARRNYQHRFSLHMDMEELNIVKESSDERFIRKAIENVHENYKNPNYETSDFVVSMGMSKTIVHAKMQTLVGQTPGNFIRNYRLNAAKKLLSDKKDERSISEIAYEVGFNDPKYFSRCFMKQYKISPSSFAKENGENL